MNAEYIIVGAGLSGIVLAERLASIGKEVLMIEKKPHIGGTCYDCYNHEGLLIPQYGPHIFNKRGLGLCQPFFTIFSVSSSCSRRNRWTARTHPV